MQGLAQKQAHCCHKFTHSKGNKVKTVIILIFSFFISTLALAVEDKNEVLYKSLNEITQSKCDKESCSIDIYNLTCVKRNFPEENSSHCTAYDLNKKITLKGAKGFNLFKAMSESGCPLDYAIGKVYVSAKMITCHFSKLNKRTHCQGLFNLPMLIE